MYDKEDIRCERVGSEETQLRISKKFRVKFTGKKTLRRSLGDLIWSKETMYESVVVQEEKVV